MLPVAENLSPGTSMNILIIIRHILEMIRFSHTLFALPIALLAAVMAWVVPTPVGGQVPFRWSVLLGVLLCMVFARSAAMAFNRIVDRDIDAKNLFAPVGITESLSFSKRAIPSDISYSKLPEKNHGHFRSAMNL